MSSTARPIDRAPGVVRLVNGLVRRLVAAGMPFGPNVLLTVRGRTSGIPRTFPVAIVKLGHRRFVQSPYGEVNWIRNLRQAGNAVVTKGRHREAVLATELQPEIGGPILRAALVPYNRTRVGRAVARQFFAIAPDASDEDYVAYVQQHPMFELTPREGTKDVA